MDAGMEARFRAYVQELEPVLGRKSRGRHMADYCTGLMLPLERKSIEPVAAALRPERVSAEHQALMHFVSEAPWDDAAVLQRVAQVALPKLTAQGPIEAWIIDDTQFRKKGKHSVGVARQYCGEVGKTDNCQAAVSLSLANAHGSLPVAFQLYLPRSWAEDTARRKKAKVPEAVRFATKPAIALAQIKAGLAAGLPRAPLLMDAAYGGDLELRRGLIALGIPYVAQIPQNSRMHDPSSGTAFAARRQPRRGKHGIEAAEDIAKRLGPEAWKTIQWREGSSVALASRFARLRVTVAWHGRTDHQPEWLLIEWPEGADSPTYWLSTLPEEVSFEALVKTAKMRWRIERDYQDLKQELGFDHFEGRSWRGFHHHASLCIAAYGFLICERQNFPPSGAPQTRSPAHPRLPEVPRPRGSTAPRPAPCP
jgi:SRSO17 transposase